MEDFAHSLRTFSIQQTVESEEIIVAGEWAFDRANVHTAICSREGGDAKHFDSNSVTILRKQSGGWCVARAIGAIVQQREQLADTRLERTAEKLGRSASDR